MRIYPPSLLIAPLLALAALSPSPLLAQKESDATDRLDAAADVLSDMMHADDKGIPQDLMNKATCVIIVPNMKKAGFIFGAKYGRGFAVCRRTGGQGWTAPAGIRIEGGSFGFQIGGTEQDAVLLVMNERGMKHLASSKFTLGGDATVAAGPVGRAATAQTDASMRAEMLSYSRARGIFAGIVLDGATLRPDDSANRDLYDRKMDNRTILTGGVTTPPKAAKLESLLNRDSSRKSN
jgi:SH3 domain-containing YSC84-like protein 1